MSYTLYGLSLSLFLVVGSGLAPAWLLHNLQADYAVAPSVKWGQRNVIIVLGGGIQKVSGATLFDAGPLTLGADNKSR